MLKVVPIDALAATIEGMELTTKTGYGLDDLVEAVLARRAETSTETGDPHERMRDEEYEALSRGAPDSPDNPDFVCSPGDLGVLGREFFSNLMLVQRLREVRVLESFSRLLPAAPSNKEMHAPIYAEDPGWLPAIEVRGEGVFIEIDQEILKDWAASDDVLARVGVIEARQRAAHERLGLALNRPVSPSLVLTHSLAHALINQWALDSGYPTASLRERLFVSADHAALLIYTATSDSAGSMGGIVGQAEQGTFEGTLSQAISHAKWCSSDPVCIETQASGTDGLNLAACHACLLLPETSCEERNLLLDRALLVGTPESPVTGFLTRFD